MPPRLVKRVLASLALLCVAGLASGCSLQKLAIRKAGNALAGSGGVYAQDDDPQLVGEAIPFALKTMEGLLAQDPENGELLAAAGSGFTQYAWGWVQLPARRLQESDYEAAGQQLARARRLYLRGRDYSLRALELRHPGFRDEILADPEAAAARLGRADVPLAYWTAAAWGGAIGVGKDQPELLADLPAIQALLRRVLELDETWGGGVAHEAAITLAAAVPAMGGGGAAAARQHFDRAVAISGGRHAAPYLALAESVALPAQDRAAFDELLAQALAVDVNAEPGSRLANLLAQEHAAWLRDNAGNWFLDDGGDEPFGEDPGEGDGELGDGAGAPPADEPTAADPPGTSDHR